MHHVVDQQTDLATATVAIAVRDDTLWPSGVPRCLASRLLLLLQVVRRARPALLVVRSSSSTAIVAESSSSSRSRARQARPEVSRVVAIGHAGDPADRLAERPERIVVARRGLSA